MIDACKRFVVVRFQRMCGRVPPFSCGCAKQILKTSFLGGVGDQPTPYSPFLFFKKRFEVFESGKGGSLGFCKSKFVWRLVCSCSYLFSDASVAWYLLPAGRRPNGPHNMSLVRPGARTARLCLFYLHYFASCSSGFLFFSSWGGVLESPACHRRVILKEVLSPFYFWVMVLLLLPGHRWFVGCVFARLPATKRVFFRALVYFGVRRLGSSCWAVVRLTSV